MRKIALLFTIIFLASLAALAQKPAGTIKGTVIDATGKQPLAGATVFVMLTKDSSVSTYTVSDKKGIFEIKDLASDSYKLLISFQGYLSYEKIFSITDVKQLIDIGSIIMKKDFHSLNTFVVKSDVPIQIKGDTTQFNASAFKTLPNANAEDLLKKLPGVEVDVDGNVKAQGEEVTKIYVDGNEFITNKKWINGKFNWQEGYGVFSYSHSHIDNVIKYINNQEEHHKKTTFKTEYSALLHKFAIPFEDKYLFEFFD